MHIVARKHHAALHFRFFDIVDRQAQSQLQIGIARAAGLVQGLTRHARKRGGAHDGQQLGQRPARIGIDRHHGVGQVGNLRLHLGQPHARRADKAAGSAAHLHGRALENQLTCQLRQRRPGQRAGGLQPGRNIGVGHVRDAGCNAEISLAGVIEGQVAQITLHTKLHVAGTAAQDGVAHIVARFGRKGQWEITVHAGSVGTHQRSRKVHHTGKARKTGALAGVAGAPAGAQFALRIRVGKPDIAGLYRQAWPIHLPAHLCAQLVQRQDRFFKNPRQDQPPRRDGQAGFATGLGHFDVHTRTAQAGKRVARLPRPGSQGQPRHLAAHLVLLQRLQRAAPGGMHLIDQALGGVGL